jgi:anti-sigma regulatory factor (Ser/Thr protein kinase)
MSVSLENLHIDSNNPIIRLSFDLPEDIYYITPLRRTTRCLLESLGVGRQDTDDVELLIGELATNAVRHAQAGSYHVAIEFTGELATVIVIDKGTGMSLAPTVAPELLDLDEIADGFTERIGGFGLPLVFSLADEVDVSPNEPQGTTVRARKKLTPQKPA